MNAFTRLYEYHLHVHAQQSRVEAAKHHKREMIPPKVEAEGRLSVSRGCADVEGND